MWIRKMPAHRVFGVNTVYVYVYWCFPTVSCFFEGAGQVVLYRHRFFLLVPGDASPLIYTTRDVNMVLLTSPFYPPVVSS